MGENKRNFFWVNPADGVLEQVSDQTLYSKYTNRSFIEEIQFDDSSMGKLMSSKYPSETEVILKSTPPKHWVKWEKTPIKNI